MSEGRDVGHGEVARAEQLERNERMRRSHHPEGKRRGREHAEREDDVADRIAPLALLAVDRAEREAADRERDDRGADPVELRRRLPRRGSPARASRSPTAATATSGTLMKNAARQEIVSTRRPPISGPRIVVAPEAPAQVPNARPCSSPEKLAVRSASEPGTRSAPAAPWRTRNRTSSSMFGRQAAEHRGRRRSRPGRTGTFACGRRSR